MYHFNFEPVFAGFDQLLIGAWLTIQLSVAAMMIGLVVSIICAAGKTSGIAPLRWLIDVYIEVIRNTPFLVQIFFIFFGLPSLGLRLTPNSAALVALVVNFGAYGTEIIRAGIEFDPEGAGGGGDRTRSLEAADLPLYHHEAGASYRISLTDQPVHLPDADLERRIGDFRR